MLLVAGADDARRRGGHGSRGRPGSRIAALPQPSTFWQHPFVDVFKTYGVASSERRGDVVEELDKEISKRVFRIQGAVAANNFLRLPHPKGPTRSLGLTGDYVYLHVRDIGLKYFVVHLDFTVAVLNVLRITLSNMYSEVKPMSRCVQCPCAVSHSWAVVCVHVPSVLALCAGLPPNSFVLKSVQLCSNIIVRNVYTSDIRYSPDRLPREMMLDHQGCFDGHYAWVDVPGPHAPQQAMEVSDLMCGRDFSFEAEDESNTHDLVAEAALASASAPSSPHGAAGRSFGADSSVMPRSDAAPPPPFARLPDPVLEVSKLIGVSTANRSMADVPRTIPRRFAVFVRSAARTLDLTSSSLASGGQEPFVDRVLYASSMTLCLMDPRTRSQRCFFGHSRPIELLEASDDGAWVASAQGSEGTAPPLVRLWRVEPGGDAITCAYVLSCPSLNQVGTMAFDPLAKYLALSGSDAKRRQQILVWDISRVAAGGKATPLARHTSTEQDIDCLKFSPFGELQIVTCGRESIRFWRVKDGHMPGQSVVLNSLARQNHFTSITFEHNKAAQPYFLGEHAADHQRMFVGTSKGKVLQLSYRERKVQMVYSLHNDAITSMCGNEGFVVTASADGYVRVWPLDFESFYLHAMHDSAAVGVDITADGLQLLCSTADGSVGLLDMQTHAYTDLARSHGATICDAAVFNVFRELVTVSEDGTLKVWNLETMDQTHDFSVSDDVPTVVACHPGKRHVFAVGFRSGSLRVFDVDGPAILCEHRHHLRPVLSVAFVPVGEGQGRAHIVTCDAVGALAIHDEAVAYEVVRTPERPLCPLPPEGCAAMVCTPPRLLQYLDAHSVGLSTYPRLEPVRRLRVGDGSSVTSLSLSTSGNDVGFGIPRFAMVGTSDSRVLLFSAVTGDLTASYFLASGMITAISVTAVAVAPDSEEEASALAPPALLLAASADALIRLARVDAEDGGASGAARRDRLDEQCFLGHAVAPRKLFVTPRFVVSVSTREVIHWAVSNEYIQQLILRQRNAERTEAGGCARGETALASSCGLSPGGAEEAIDAASGIDAVLTPSLTPAGNNLFELFVTIYDATGLEQLGFSGGALWCECEVFGRVDSRRTTQKVQPTLNTVWNETHVLPWRMGERLRFVVHEDGTGTESAGELMDAAFATVGFEGSLPLTSADGVASAANLQVRVMAKMLAGVEMATEDGKETGVASAADLGQGIETAEFPSAVPAAAPRVDAAGTLPSTATPVCRSCGGTGIDIMGRPCACGIAPQASVDAADRVASEVEKTPAQAEHTPAQAEQTPAEAEQTPAQADPMPQTPPAEAEQTPPAQTAPQDVPLQLLGISGCSVLPANGSIAWNSARKMLCRVMGGAVVAEVLDQAEESGSSELQLVRRLPGAEAMAIDLDPVGGALLVALSADAMATGGDGAAGSAWLSIWCLPDLAQQCALELPDAYLAHWRRYASAPGIMGVDLSPPLLRLLRGARAAPSRAVTVAVMVESGTCRVDVWDFAASGAGSLTFSAELAQGPLDLALLPVAAETQAQEDGEDAVDEFVMVCTHTVVFWRAPGRAPTTVDGVGLQFQLADPPEAWPKDSPGGFRALCSVTAQGRKLLLAATAAGRIWTFDAGENRLLGELWIGECRRAGGVHSIACGQWPTLLVALPGGMLHAIDLGLDADGVPHTVAGSTATSKAEIRLDGDILALRVGPGAFQGVAATATNTLWYFDLASGVRVPLHAFHAGPSFMLRTNKAMALTAGEEEAGDCVLASCGSDGVHLWAQGAQPIGLLPLATYRGGVACTAISFLRRDLLACAFVDGCLRLCTLPSFAVAAMFQVADEQPLMALEAIDERTLVVGTGSGQLVEIGLDLQYQDGSGWHIAVLRQARLQGPVVPSAVCRISVDSDRPPARFFLACFAGTELWVFERGGDKGGSSLLLHAWVWPDSASRLPAQPLADSPAVAAEMLAEPPLVANFISISTWDGDDMHVVAAAPPAPCLHVYSCKQGTIVQRVDLSSPRIPPVVRLVPMQGRAAHSSATLLVLCQDRFLRLRFENDGTQNRWLEEPQQIFGSLHRQVNGVFSMPDACELPSSGKDPGVLLLKGDMAISTWVA